jgi:predicted transcriptional regulator
MDTKQSNSKRFLNSYNLIDSALRMQGDMRRSISYTEAIRRAAKTNSIVAKYEDDLIDYGRLRNAIVHSSNDELIIAEPHLKVVEDFEKIASLICTPPLAINTVAKKVVSCIEYNVKLKQVIEFDYTSGFSNIPIFKNGMLIGVANGKKILEVLGKKIYEKININDYIENTKIEDVLKEFSSENYYTIVNEKVTLDKVLNLFTENKKLLLVLITKSGSLLEAPLGIITITDIMDINKVLDNFNLTK